MNGRHTTALQAQTRETVQIRQPVTGAMRQKMHIGGIVVSICGIN